MPTVELKPFSEYFDEKYVRRLRRLSERTRETYINYLHRFYREFGFDFSEKSIESFLSSLPKSARQKAYCALKHYGEFYGIYPKAMTLKDFPRDFFYDKEVDRKVEPFTFDEVVSFIDAIQYNDKGNLNTKAAITLCIVYGLRKVEIEKLKKTDIDLENRKFLVRTAKKGKTRWHYIPVQILPVFIYIKKKFRQFKEVATSENRLATFHKIAGVENKPYRKFHSFRRALVTELFNAGATVPEVVSFLRWSMKDIAFTYYRPDPKIIDEKIFKIHPFLPYFDTKAMLARFAIKQRRARKKKL